MEIINNKRHSQSWRLNELLPAELEARLVEKPIVILPFGTIEWHSYHLPIGLDSLKAEALCERVAAQTGAILGPTTHWAVGGVPFPYTLRFDLDLIESLARQIFQQMALVGFRVIIALTGHYGLEQTLMLKRAALETMRTSTVTIFAGGEYEVVTDTGYHGDHAARWETSLLWAIRPDLVRLKDVEMPQPLDGIIGQDPRGSASPELGAEICQLVGARLGEMAERFLNGTTTAARLQYIEALASCVRVLNRLLDERKAKPKSQVPPVTTPSYLKYLDAIYCGDYLSAQRYADIKLMELSA